MGPGKPNPISPGTQETEEASTYPEELSFMHCEMSFIMEFAPVLSYTHTGFCRNRTFVVVNFGSCIV